MKVVDRVMSDETAIANLKIGETFSIPGEECICIYTGKTDNHPGVTIAMFLWYNDDHGRWERDSVKCETLVIRRRTELVVLD
jgi:hypothetical protein